MRVTRRLNDVFLVQMRDIGQDPSDLTAGAEFPDDHVHGPPHSANAGLTTHLGGTVGHPIEVFRAHILRMP